MSKYDFTTKLNIHCQPTLQFLLSDMSVIFSSLRQLVLPRATFYTTLLRLVSFVFQLFCADFHAHWSFRLFTLTWSKRSAARAIAFPASLAPWASSPAPGQTAASTATSAGSIFIISMSCCTLTQPPALSGLPLPLTSLHPPTHTPHPPAGVAARACSHSAPVLERLIPSLFKSCQKTHCLSKTRHISASYLWFMVTIFLQPLGHFICGPNVLEFRA